MMKNHIHKTICIAVIYASFIFKIMKDKTKHLSYVFHNALIKRFLRFLNKTVTYPYELIILEQDVKQETTKQTKILTKEQLGKESERKEIGKGNYHQDYSLSTFTFVYHNPLSKQHMITSLCKSL